MDKRIHSVNRFLTDYSQGRFARKLEITGPPDDLNACLTGLNILGEELEARTISRDYLANIVNSVSDMVFILSADGTITDTNFRVGEQLPYEPSSLAGLTLDNLLADGRPPIQKTLLNRLGRSKSATLVETALKSAALGSIPVLISASWLKDKKGRKIGIVATAKDITERLQAEIRVLRAVIDTQEKERQRLALDLHDSLGQKISAIIFYLSATAENTKRAGQREMLIRSNDALIGVLAEMRALCFNLMPQTLNSFGLARAVKELVKQLDLGNRTHITVNCPRSFPSLPKSLEIDLFRIIQEFISNAINHGKARNIWILLNARNGQIGLELRDDGRGFNTNKRVSGMGLRNAQSRIKSHGGSLDLKSKRGEGTCMLIQIVLK